MFQKTDFYQTGFEPIKPFAHSIFWCHSILKCSLLLCLSLKKNFTRIDKIRNCSPKNKKFKWNCDFWNVDDIWNECDFECENEILNPASNHFEFSFSITFEEFEIRTLHLRENPIRKFFCVSFNFTLLLCKILVCSPPLN